MNEVITNNYTSGHQAIDIVSSTYTESDVIALKSGTVQTVVSNVEGTNHNSKGLATYGNFIKIKQDDGKTALYAHLKPGSVTVNKGQAVNKGDVIGTMGETGNAYGKHLHLEIVDGNGSHENPIVSLNEKQEEPITQEANNLENNSSISENNNQIHDVENNSSENSNQNNDIENNSSIPENNNQNINVENNTTPYNNTEDNNSIPCNNSKYLNASNYKNGSIVDALKSIGEDSSYDYRKQLAIKNGIVDYHGSYQQNIKLLNLIKKGLLKKI